MLACRTAALEACPAGSRPRVLAVAATLRIMEDHIETELQNTKPKGNLHIDLHMHFFLRILVGQCEIF